MSCHAKRRTEKLPISEMIEKLQEFMPLKKPFKIKYRKNKQSYSRQDQPTNTNDHQWNVFSTAIEWLNNFEKKKIGHIYGIQHQNLLSLN